MSWGTLFESARHSLQILIRNPRLAVTYPSASQVRLGHAYWSGRGVPDVVDLEPVLRILRGESKLEPRPSSAPGAVSHAESILGVKRGVVYAYVGCLHPDLGTIGLIIKPRCLRGRLHGTTRCDSGGLAGRLGSFAHVAANQVDDALRALSIIGGNRRWLLEFADEISRSYVDTRQYISGTVPDHKSWNDIRSKCIEADFATGVDRRLWTWEIRLHQPPAPGDFEALVVSHEAFKHLESLYIDGHDVPGRVGIIHGSIGELGVEYFAKDLVYRLLGGMPSGR